MRLPDKVSSFVTYKSSELPPVLTIDSPQQPISSSSSIIVNLKLENKKYILDQTINTNSFGPLNVTKAFLPFIKSPGRIVMISSGGGVLNGEVGGWSPAYCVSKTLLNAITKQLAHELRDRNISVNAVCPGWVRTDLGGAGASRSVEKGAETPVWLSSEASQNLTGLFFRDKAVISW